MKQFLILSYLQLCHLPFPTRCTFWLDSVFFSTEIKITNQDGCDKRSVVIQQHPPPPRNCVSTYSLKRNYPIIPVFHVSLANVGTQENLYFRIFHPSLGSRWKPCSGYGNFVFRASKHWHKGGRGLRGDQCSFSDVTRTWGQHDQTTSTTFISFEIGLFLT